MLVFTSWEEKRSLRSGRTLDRDVEIDRVVPQERVPDRAADEVCRGARRRRLPGHPGQESGWQAPGGFHERA